MAFKIGGDGIMRYQGRLCVPGIDRLQGRILAEAQELCYMVQLGLMKMYHDLKEINL